MILSNFFNKVFLLLYDKWEIFYKNVVKLKIMN